MGQLIDFLLRHPLLVGATGLAIIATIVMELRLRSQSSFAVAAQQAVRLINQGATVVDLARRAEPAQADEMMLAALPPPTQEVPDAQQVAPAGPPDGGVRPRLEAAEELQGPVPTPQGGAGVQPGRQGGRSDVQGSRRAVGPARS